MICLLLLIGLLIIEMGVCVTWAGEQKKSTDADEINQENETTDSGETIIEPELLEEKSGVIKDEMIADMELDEVQNAVSDLLGDEAFDLKVAIGKLISGEQVFSKEYCKELIGNIFLAQFNAQKKSMLHVVLLVIVAALFTNFANVFENGHVGEISFYMIYLLLLAILIQSFGTLSSEIHETLMGITNFMKVLTPAYFLAIVAASGAGSAMIFYEMVLLLIYFVQVILLTVVLPGVNVYVLLELVNYLHNEDFLSKLAELLRMLIEWSLKTCLAVIVGLQVIQNMVAPALDSLKRTFAGKTAGAIPGIGNAIGAVTEVVLGTAVLVRNCLGVASIVVLILVCVSPLIRLGITTILYKFLAALIQPISDKRMVGCLSTVGEGCVLLIKILVTTQILFIITIAILTTSFFAHS